MEQSTRLTFHHEAQQVQLGVRGYQRLARDAVSQAALNSSARLETTLRLEMRHAKSNTESTMQQR